MAMSIKSLFPILQSNNLVYLDSASTTQKPLVVIDSITNHYQKSNSNIHRGLYKIAQSADNQWLEAHKKVAKYLNAKTYKEIVFTKNCTESINLVANSVVLEENDVVVTTIMEHHSNFLPWKKICEEVGAKLEIIPITDQGIVDIEKFKSILKDYGTRVKVVALVHQSNVLGTVNPVKEIVSLAQAVGALTVVDGAQSIAHMRIDVQDLNCDIYTFSSHKVYGPTGVGVLYCKEEILNRFKPWIVGGEMVSSVSIKDITYSDLPWRFEAGTPAIEAGIGLSKAIDWFESTIEELGGWEKYMVIERELTDYTLEKLSEIKGLKLLGEGRIERVGVVSFNIDGIHPHDIASLLGEQDICIRAGYHCAQPLHTNFKSKGTVRVSLGVYNDREDIDRLVDELKKIISMFN